ncbi:putative FK506-binding protein (FKBP)-type peptidyl-prolyl isomerase [Leptomonas pyrrhocoris]|uniref:peptidylprolyl isomerase n=1 Tax=Leptomonas pyrrhocoris TaxID=157538 RepID=A0A0M9G615_LEPPY|nr:putative FK506-binding protein (FKBP)-type peptidyl-prolyl isomerase [Leptomonas pyrrhocoris]KPA82939.1 putative FK506-binding protein (FKBP)-type peptidyl-prolyl isomerase [Leptomonas pyrrhocoris]|eukprot:XP_015661378.1 putative FK506-binding protein (FKBP)-type peptidyl-prolyl isomerase [Leptomonas pyrrhocoris]
MEDQAVSSNASSVSDDSQPPMEVNYPLNEEVEVPDTNGGLHKTVLVEGTGARPVKGAKVSVHYVGTLEDGTKFDSSRDRGEYFDFTLGRGQVIKGWDKGVATMHIGEKAILKCSPEYGYGASGSPPKIPANATLLFEVELFAWSREVDISAAKDKSLMMDVLKDGVEYENPAFESSVTMDVRIYVGKFDPEGEEEEHVPVKALPNWEVVVGVTPLPPYLEDFLHKMRKQEAAACRVRSDLIQDAVPEFGIPSSADRNHLDVTYVVEVSAMSRSKTYDFDGLPKIAEGEKRKDAGNDAFKAGDLVLAEKYYRRALEFVGEDYGYDDADKPACHRVRISVMGNLAQVLLMREKYADSADFSRKVLGLDAENTKALFRLAKAQDGMQDWDAAMKNVSKILAADPSNTDAAALKSKIQQSQKAYDQKQKSMFKKLFS